jgi:DDE superfamily endonuclease
MPHGPAGRGLFPPEQTNLVKALACERPTDEKHRPLARFSVSDVCLRGSELGLSLSYSTVWRRLAEDALRPWLQEQWLFPRDPRFLEKATPALELYHRRWQGEPLGPEDVVLCADEMTNLQALSRLHRGLPPAPGRRARYEFEYERHGTLCYLAFLEVFTGRIYGEVTEQNGILPFEQALGHCLKQPHLAKAKRVFLIVDNGSSHHPNTSPVRLRQQFPQVEAVHLPTHASWLNQIEIYFSITRRKALTPADFSSKADLQERLLRFQCRYNQRAEPFTWNYTKEQLARYLERIAAHEAAHTERQQALNAYRSHELTGAHCLMN